MSELCILICPRDEPTGPTLTELAGSVRFQDTQARPPTVGRGRRPAPAARPPGAAVAHLTPAVLEGALVGEGVGVFDVGAGAEKVAEFIVRRTETGGCVERATPPHGIVALLDAAMVLLDAVVHEPTGAMMRVGAPGSPAPHAGRNRDHPWSPSPAPALQS